MKLSSINLQQILFQETHQALLQKVAVVVLINQEPLLQQVITY